MDPQAEREFGEFVGARSTALLRTAYLLTGGHREQSEDLLQNALTKTALRWNRIRRSDRADVYVRRAMYHEQVSSWRRRRLRREDPVGDLPDVMGADDQMTVVHLRLPLVTALAQLTAKQRTIVVLRYAEDLPEAQVAEIVGCSVGTVRRQTFDAVRRLRALLPDLWTEPAEETTR